MADEEKDTEFKFRIDEESPDEVLKDDRRKRRRTKPAKKSSIILPLSLMLLLTVLCALGYLDLRKRLTIDQTFDAQSVSGLAREVESKFEELGNRTTALEESLSQATAGNKKSIDSLNFRLHKADYRIKKINETMVDKKTQQKDHQALLARLDQLSSQVQAMDDNFAQKLNDVTGSVKSSRIDLTQIKANMATKADQQDVQKEMADQRRQWQKALQTIERDMAARINRLQQEIAQARQTIQSLQAGQKRLQSQSNTAPPPAKPSDNPPPEPQTSKEIIEKDI